MARPGTINSTKAVEVSIHAVAPESIGKALLVSPPKANTGAANASKNAILPAQMRLHMMLVSSD
jgi:hypothetical protein